MRVACWIKE